MVRLSSMWVCLKEIVRVSPSAVAVCRLSQPTMTSMPAIAVQ